MRFTDRGPCAVRRYAILGMLAGLLAACSTAPHAPKPNPTAAVAKVSTGPRPESKEGGVPASVQRAYDAGLDALNAGRRDEAERAFRALSKSEPDLGGPHANLGIIYRQSGKLPDSVSELEQAIHLNPGQAVYWNQLGISYRYSGDFAKARDAYEKAIALDPNYAVPYLNLGILFDIYLWDSKRALELYDRFLALSPNGDERVTKWIADIKNRQTKVGSASRKERE